MIYFIPNSRSYTVLSNLHHAFPNKDQDWIRKVAHMNMQRMVEMFLFALASPSITKKRMQEVLSFTNEDLKELAEIMAPKGGIGLVPHLTLFESIPILPAFMETDTELYTVYRPLDHKEIDKWIKKSRSRFGLRLLSRKDGLIRIFKLIQKKAFVALLFEQNAGDGGVLITAFDRVASATDLPGLIAQRTQCGLTIVCTKRTGFWRATLHVERLPVDLTVEETTIWCNNWLEDYLRSSDDACADWLWGHRRWHTQDKPSTRFRIKHKKNYLEACLKDKGQTALPQRTRLWFRLPNWLSDVVMAIPLLKAVSKARPDAEITLLVQKRFAQLLRKMDLADRIIIIPEKNKRGYFSFFKNLRHQYPDCYTLLTNSTRGDLEAILTRTKQRFGIERPGKQRPFLTNTWKVPDHYDESKIHQTGLWEAFFKHFGLLEPIDLEPVKWNSESKRPDRKIQVIGLICGTQNEPSKQWPISHWRKLIKAIRQSFPDSHIKLFGTIRNRSITDQVADGFDAISVSDIAVETSLLEFTDHLNACRLIIGNDTGGIHLANCIGVPVIPLFGPTNPVRTGPIFEAPHTIIQPEGAPETGGVSIQAIKPETVLVAVKKLLKFKE